MIQPTSLKYFGLSVGTALVMKVLVGAFLRLRRGFANLGTCPGRYALWMHPFHTTSLMTASFFPPRGWLAHYGGKFSLYAKEGSTILSALIVWDATPMFWLADAEAIKLVASDRHIFRKETEAYKVLEIYGKNLVSTDGDEWRRHLAIAGPAFNEANYALNWAETLRAVCEWFDELDDHPAVATTGTRLDVNAAMTQATLLVISAAGFGMRAPWSAFSTGSPSHSLNDGSRVLLFPTALALTIEKLFVKVLTPSFAYVLPIRVPWLSAQLDAARRAFASLQVHMQALVSEARSGVEGEANLLRRLVEANDASQALGEAGGKGTLTDGELFSNIFTFLLAGHETSAHTLSFAIMLLAIYPDVQKKLRAEALRVWPTPDDFASSTNKRDFEQFEYALAIFRETLRCFPSEPRLNKIVEADTVLTGTRFSSVSSPLTPKVSYDGALTNVEFTRDDSKDQRFSVHIQKGSAIIMDIWGVHMSPLYWGPDAHLFRPERFIDTANYKWPRDAFLPFSAGARRCIGQRFATTESVCLLASIARHYEILLPDGLQANTLSEADKRCLLKWTTGVTITPTNSFVRLRKYAE
ncbi:cytochrome P450 [Phellopilus nigrolimitatus]|nr:cytochrome P450 [Phellopilus nigrolimitatus]